MGLNAIVWKARSLHSGKMIALKQIPKINGQITKQAQTEVNVQNKLSDNENICQLLDILDTKEDVWLIYNFEGP